MLMPITIGSNISSLSAQRQLSSATERTASTYQRLSSGQRIVRASDDAAGLSITSSLNARSRVLNKGAQNINDGLSFLSIAEGALNELKDITIRIKELATQAATGSLSRTQRVTLQGESDRLTAEFNRIVSSTSFNGTQVLDASTGSLRIQAGYGVDGGLSTKLNDDLERAIGTNSLSYKSTQDVVAISDAELADLNGDGKLDLVRAVSGSSNIIINLGDGAGTFGANTTITGGYGSGGELEIGDIDGDGDLDIIKMTLVASRTGFTVYTNTSGTFAVSSTTQDSGVAYNNLQLADLDNDGRADLVFNDPTTSIRSKLAQSNGTLGTTSTIIASTYGMFTLGDFSGDGITDIVSSDYFSQSLRLQLGNGSGGFGSVVKSISLPATGIANITSLVAGDFNRDGLLDIASTQTDYPTSSLAVYLNTGNNNFQTATTQTDLVINSRVSPVDFDNDGFLDLLGILGSSYVSLRGAGDGTFATPNSLPGHSTFIYAQGDINSDLVPDLISSASSITYVGLQNTTDTSNAKYVSLATQAQAREALDTTDQALARITAELSNIGAAQSRMQTMLATLTVDRENAVSAAGRILDADVAAESAQLIRSQILQQSAQSVLAQANQLPTLALSLLRTLG
jgi:flagellin